MNSEEIYTLLESKSVKFAFDTDAIHKGERFVKLCQNINRVNSYRGGQGLSLQIDKWVSAIAHTERLFDYRQIHANNYNPGLVARNLELLEVIVKDFSEADAEQCAEMLGEQFPANGAWYLAKRQRALECVGLPTNYWEFAKGSGKECGAPNDWFILSHAVFDEATLLVMDDQGRGMYDFFDRKVTFEATEQAVSRLVETVVN